MIRYAGIGSRDTPHSLKELINQIGYYMANDWNAMLVSGGARGADSFFEEGCDYVLGMKEIWLPELGFNKSRSTLLPSKEAFIVAERFVGHWKSCNDWAKAAHARNSHQVLGADLRSPVNFIVCWTPEGKVVGGTATALTIAKEFDVPVFNLGCNFKDENDRRDQVVDFLLEHAPKEPRRL